jgi:mannosyl-3-phosphoglycerate phosphatase
VSSVAFNADTPLVVVARLDGGVFDPWTGDPDAAIAAAGLIVRAGLPLVFLSSRTRAELELVHQELAISHPFVAENGGALFCPRHYFGADPIGTQTVAGYHRLPFGLPYDDVVGRLRQAAQRVDIRIVGFHEMSVRQVADEWGLSLLRARLAKLREYDEPFRLEHDDPELGARLVRTLQSAGLRCVPAGAFWHAGAGPAADVLVDHLRTLYGRALGRRPVIAAFGDAVVDLALLRSVDIPLISDAVAGGPPDDVLADLGVSHIVDRVAALREIVSSAERRLRQEL